MNDKTVVNPEVAQAKKPLLPAWITILYTNYGEFLLSDFSPDIQFRWAQPGIIRKDGMADRRRRDGKALWADTDAEARIMWERQPKSAAW